MGKQKRWAAATEPEMVRLANGHQRNGWALNLFLEFRVKEW